MFYFFIFFFPLQRPKYKLLPLSPASLLKYLNLLLRKTVLYKQTRSGFMIVIGMCSINRNLFPSFRILSNQPRNLSAEYTFSKMWLECYNKFLSTNKLDRIACFLILAKRYITCPHCLRRPLTYPTPNLTVTMNAGWMTRALPYKGTAWGPLLPNVIYFLPPTPGHTNLYSAQRWATAIKKHLPTSNAWPADPSWGSGHPY